MRHRPQRGKRPPANKFGNQGQSPTNRRAKLPQRQINTTDHALAQAALTSGDTETAIYTRLTLLLDKRGKLRLVYADRLPDKDAIEGLLNE
ncbi:MAG: hypothetical protein IID30_08240 [Planctomycetes bacterium]|nr:hypothetical protein [Planctomycetota bacterium]MCH7603081.1 hypothetical protein [Planctomycetota bacterium]